MTEQLQEHSFTFHAGPAVYSGWKAMEHLPWEFSRRGVKNPFIIYRDDQEGKSLWKALRHSLERGGYPGITPVVFSRDCSLSETQDGIAALGEGDIQEHAKIISLNSPGIPLFTILSDRQVCSEAGSGTDARRFPDAVFLDPASYHRSRIQDTACSAVTALAVLTESLQDDRAHSLLYSLVRTGLHFLSSGTSRMDTLISRHAVANACTAAAAAGSNTVTGAVTAVSEIFHVSGFCTRAEASAALLPFLVKKMRNEGCRSFNVLSREKGDAAGFILDLLETLQDTAGLGDAREKIISLTRDSFELSGKAHSAQVMDLFRSISGGIRQ